MKKKDILSMLQSGKISVAEASALLTQSAPKRGEVVRRERTPAADLSGRLSDAASRILELHSCSVSKKSDELPLVLGRSPASNVEEICDEILAFCDLGSIANVNSAARAFRSAIAVPCTRRYLDGLRPPATPANHPAKTKPKPRKDRKPSPVAVATPTPQPKPERQPETNQATQPEAKEYSQEQLTKIVDCLNRNREAGIPLLKLKTGIAERVLAKSIIPALLRDNVICEVATERGARYRLLSK